MSITASSINQWNTETGAKAVLKEWLDQWFDGNAHTVYVESNSQTYTFPKATIKFDVTETEQPMQDSGAAYDVEIRVIIDPRNTIARTADGGLFTCQNVDLNFWISAAMRQQTGTGNANYLVNKTSDLLAGLINNPSYKADLGRKGIRNIRGGKGRTYDSGTGYKTRLQKVSAELQYNIASTP